MVRRAHPQQETRSGRFAEHAGRHQGRKSFEVRYVWIHSSLRPPKIWRPNKTIVILVCG